MSKETLCTPRTGLEILLRNWLAGSKPVVSISQDAAVHCKQLYEGAGHTPLSNQVSSKRKASASCE